MLSTATSADPLDARCPPVNVLGACTGAPTGLGFIHREAAARRRLVGQDVLRSDQVSAEPSLLGAAACQGDD